MFQADQNGTYPRYVPLDEADPAHAAWIQMTAAGVLECGHLTQDEFDYLCLSLHLLWYWSQRPDSPDAFWKEVHYVPMDGHECSNRHEYIAPGGHVAPPAGFRPRFVVSTKADLTGFRLLVFGDGQVIA